MRRVHLKMTVRQLMLCFCLVTTLVFSGILLFGFMNQRKGIIRQNRAGFEQLLTQMTQNVESKCSRYNTMLTQMAYSQPLQEYLETEGRTYDRDGSSQVTQYLRNFIAMDDTIVDAALFGTNGKQLNLSGDIGEQKEAGEDIPVKIPYYYTGMKVMNISLNYTNYRECIVLGARIYSMETYDRENPIGTLLLVLDAEKLMSLGGTNELGTVQGFAYDREDQLFCLGDLAEQEVSPEELKEKVTSGRERIVLNGEPYSVQSGDVEYLNGRIVLMIAEKDLLRSVNRLRQQQLLLFLAALLIEVPIFFLSIGWITGPINRLVRFFAENRDNGVTALKKRVEPEGPREILVLGENINGMLEEMDQMTHRLVDTTMRLYEAEVEKKQAELEYLYAQINPHFLFNTLESIKGCAIEEDAWKSYKMLDALGKVFRYSTSLEDDVSLGEEIRLVKNYLYIQKMRFGDKLEYEIEIPEEMAEVRIPKLLLQPIAENAVIHGIEETEGKGTIRIRGTNEGEACEICIKNDGRLLGREDMERMERLLYDGNVQKSVGKKRMHIGLHNVQKRLVQFGGGSGGIRLRPGEKGGLEVIVRIPHANPPKREETDV